MAENQISKLILEEILEIKENINQDINQDINNLEKNLIYIKLAYNNSIDVYNLNKIIFPANLIISYFKNLDINFIIWE